MNVSTTLVTECLRLGGTSVGFIDCSDYHGCDRLTGLGLGLLLDFGAALMKDGIRNGSDTS
ncbi:MAG: hypothetical protein N838_13160 [Thiohalocapsa sp. PB-PSB1]|nr:MAG: hypothetical protein N838_13160 [Thiohalocapsa sp. PB-PSB1]